MTPNLVIKNGKLVIPKIGIVKAAIVVSEGKIESICSNSHVPSAEEEIDCDGKFVLPGVIDPHVHLGFFNSFDEDAFTETRSAALGGVTSIIDYFRTENSYRKVFPRRKNIGEEKCLIDFAFHFDLISELHLQEIGVYHDFSVCSFKFHMEYKKRYNFTDGFIYRALDKLHYLNKPIKACFHCENLELTDEFEARFRKEGRNDLAALSDSRPGFTEANSLMHVAHFSRLTGTPIFVVHLSSGDGVEALRQARDQGTAIEAETCPHYLTHTKKDPSGVLAKVKPPVRGKEDMQKLWSAIAEGIITSIGSDHVSCKKMEKIGEGDIWSALYGLPGTATLLPVLLSEGVNKNRISLEKVAEITSYNTAKSFFLFPKKGIFLPGSDADLVIIDIKKEQKVSPELLRSSADFTIYDGWTLKGWPTTTIVRGKVVFDDGDIIGKMGHGQFIPRPVNT